MHTTYLVVYTWMSLKSELCQGRGGGAQGLGGPRSNCVNTVSFDDHGGCLEGVMTDDYPGPPFD